MTTCGLITRNVPAGDDAPKVYPCDKVGYTCFADAQAALNRIRHKHVFQKGRRVNRINKKKKIQRSYKCDRCGLWHLTSQVSKIKKPKK